jgi:hypothetical protein
VDLDGRADHGPRQRVFVLGAGVDLLPWHPACLLSVPSVSLW